MAPYPTSIDPADWQIVIDAISGKVPDPHKAVHCAYDALGYALGQFYKDPTAQHTMQALPPGTWLKVIQAILAFLASLGILTPAPVTP